MKEFLREKATREQITMKDCLHCVRIGFQAFLTDQHGQRSVTPVVMSDPICNSQNPGFTELRIGEIDKSKGSCAGGETIWMRCAAKVRRDQIRVKFHEPATGWEAEGVFTPNEVFEQILIIFKTPAYRDQQIEQPVHVNIHLYRTSDSEYSPPITYVYMPTDDDDLGSLEKRVRLSKLLDENEKWEQLASSLHCEHMVGLIRVCAMQDTVSPTLLFLDQYEQIPNSKLSVLANALEKLGIHEGKQLIQ